MEIIQSLIVYGGKYMATGRQESNEKYLKRIENVLVGKPEFLNGYVNSLLDCTLRTRYGYLNHVVKFMEGRTIEDLNIDTFNSYMNQISMKENGEPNTPQYCISVYFAIKRFVEYLTNTGKIEKNFVCNTKKPKNKELQRTVVKRENDYLETEDIKILMNNIENQSVNDGYIHSEMWQHRDIAIFSIFLTTGIRCAALQMLDVNDVNLEQKMISVTEKGSKARIIEISQELCDIIEAWISDRNKYMIGYDEEALFISKRKNRMDNSTIYKLVKKYSGCVKGKEMHPHTLRASYATLLYDKTEDLFFVQDCMAHADSNTTRKYIRKKKRNTKQASEFMKTIL